MASSCWQGYGKMAHSGSDSWIVGLSITGEGTGECVRREPVWCCTRGTMLPIIGMWVGPVPFR